MHITTTSPYQIVRAQAHHLSALHNIELLAATMLRGHAPESVLAETTPVEQFHRVQQQGTLWVALLSATPVGFAHVEMLDARHPHLDELDVLPDYGRRGIGSALVRTVVEWARHAGFPDVTLSTFRSVPWNMPFYSKLGFTAMHGDELSAELKAVVENESARGLAANARVIMRYDLDKSHEEYFTEPTMPL
ncbi:MAG: GNAT family N-acetyltransferase [Gemmatimonadaceae bacterium]